MTKQPTTYRPLSNGGYTYESVNRRLNRPNVTNTTPYQEQDYGVSPTGKSTGYTGIYSSNDGSSSKSNITGQNIGMSQWGKPLTGALAPEQYGAVLNQNPQVTRTIKDEMIRYFGTAPDVKVVDIVNKIVNEGMPIDQALSLVRSGHQRTEDEAYAGNLVSAEYDPAISALDRELDRISRQLGIDINTQEGFGDKYDERLKGISGELQSLLGENVDAISNIYKTAGERTGKAYSQAGEKMGQANEMLQQIIGESANQLGLGGAEGRSFEELAQALADTQGVNEASRAGAVGNMANLGADMSAIAQQSVGDSGQEFAQYRKNLIDEVMGNISQLQFQGATQQNEVGGQIADMERKRAADLSTALVDVRNARNERERQSALDQLAAEIQRGTLDLQRQQLGMQGSQFDRSFGLEEKQFEHNKAIDLANLNMQRQELEAALSQTQDPLEQMKIQAEIDKLVAQTDQINHDMATGGSGGNTTYKGIEGVQNFVNDKGLPPETSQMFMDFLGQAQAQDPGLNVGDNVIMGGLIQNSDMTPEQKYIMQMLLAVYQNNYSS